jgi:hypothetical protein
MHLSAFIRFGDVVFDDWDSEGSTEHRNRTGRLSCDWQSISCVVEITEVTARPARRPVTSERPTDGRTIGDRAGGSPIKAVALTGDGRSDAAPIAAAD